MAPGMVSNVRRVLSNVRRAMLDARKEFDDGENNVRKHENRNQHRENHFPFAHVQLLCCVAVIDHVETLAHYIVTRKPQFRINETRT